MLVRRPQSFEMLCYCGDASILHYPSRALNDLYSTFGNLLAHSYPKGYAHQEVEVGWVILAHNLWVLARLPVASTLACAA